MRTGSAPSWIRSIRDGPGRTHTPLECLLRSPFRNDSSIRPMFSKASSTE